MKKIILLGYMGSGKTTIASLLAKKRGVLYKDLDETIEKELQMSINFIFQNKGEIYFRKLEHQIFKKILDTDESFVLSLGGGTPCYANNYELLNGPNVISVYLKMSVDELYERLKTEKKQRPLISNIPHDELKDFIAQHLFERSYFYNKATITIAVSGRNPEELVEAIAKLL